MDTMTSYEFVELINKAIKEISMELEKDEKKIFSVRYLKMISYLEKLSIAFQRDKLNKNNICLSIVRMVDHGDSESVKDAVTAINHYYQNNIYEDNQ